jgi:hypothetical protein
MGGMSRVTQGEMMNAKKISIKKFESTWLRSSIKSMQDGAVRKEMREELELCCALNDKMWEKFDSIVFDVSTRFDGLKWDFPTLYHSGEARKHKSLNSLMLWIVKTVGGALAFDEWDPGDAVTISQGLQPGHVVVFKNPDLSEGGDVVGYSIGFVLQLPEPFSEFKEFDPYFHVDRLQPVDDAAGTGHAGCGSGIWFRNGCPNGTMWQPPPPYLPNSTVQVPGSEMPPIAEIEITEETEDLIKVMPEQILWSEMEWQGLSRPFIELEDAAKLNFHRTARVFKLKSPVNSLILRTRLGLKHYHPGLHKMSATVGGVMTRTSRKKK